MKGAHQHFVHAVEEGPYQMLFADGKVSTNAAACQKVCLGQLDLKLYRGFTCIDKTIQRIYARC